jgi:integrase
MLFSDANYRLTRRGTANSFYAAYVEGGVTRFRSLGTTDKKEAQKRLAEFKAWHSTPAQAEADEISLSHVLHQYRDDVGVESLSQDTSQRTIDRLLAYYDGKRVADINAATNKQFEKDMRAEGLSNSSINRIRNTLRAALKHAVKADLLVTAPFIPTLGEPPALAEWLNRKEAADLLRAVRPARWYYMRLFVLIGLYTGARHEAILSLKWDQVDLEEGTIDFRRRDKKGAVLPQSKKRRPDAPVSDRLIRFLRAAYKKREGDYVIMHRGGPVLSVKKAFASACKRAKLKGVTPHTLKHTCITWMLRGGVPVWQVSGLTATSVATITKVYGKHVQEDLKAAANAPRMPR